MAFEEIKLPTSIYDNELKNFRNSLYSLNESIESKFTDLILAKSKDRIVYSRNDFAMRKRARNQPNNNLNFPFMNYRMVKIGENTNRPWFNTLANVQGVYIEELVRYIKLSPITFQYEASFWCQRDDETNYVYQSLIYDQDVETRITFPIEIDGHEILLRGIINYELDLHPRYSDETDWLKNNKIHTIGMNFNVQTLYIKDGAEANIPKSVILNFAVNNNLGELESEQIIPLIVNKYTGEES